MFSLCDPEAALLPAHPGDHGGVVLGVVEEVPDEDVQRGDGHLQMDKVAVNQNSCITSLPYFGVKLSCVCLMFAYRKD